jgi:hypothetical protein
LFKRSWKSIVLTVKRLFVDDFQIVFMLWANALAIAFVPAVNFQEYTWVWSTVGGLLRCTLFDFQWIGAPEISLHVFWGVVSISVAFTFLRWPLHVQRIQLDFRHQVPDPVAFRFLDQFVRVFYVGILSTLARSMISFSKLDWGFTNAIAGMVTICLISVAVPLSSPLIQALRPLKSTTVLEPNATFNIGQIQTIIVALVVLCSGDDVPAYVLPVASFLVNLIVFGYIWTNTPCEKSTNRILLFAFAISIAASICIGFIAWMGDAFLPSLMALAFTVSVVTGFFTIDFDFDWGHLFWNAFRLGLSRAAPFPRKPCKKQSGQDGRWTVAGTIEMARRSTGDIATGTSDFGEPIPAGDMDDCGETDDVDGLSFMSTQPGQVVERPGSAFSASSGVDIGSNDAGTDSNSAADHSGDWISRYPGAGWKRAFVAYERMGEDKGELEERLQAERPGSSSRTAGDRATTDEVISFMALFGRRIAAVYAAMCASVCIIAMAVCYHLSQTPAVVSTVCISWMGVFFITGIVNLVTYLVAPVNGPTSRWLVDIGRVPVDVTSPPLNRHVAVLFVVCANCIAVFTISHDRCTDIGGSSTRGRVLFTAIFLDYVCLFMYTCYKWRFIVKLPGQTATVEFEMPKLKTSPPRAEQVRDQLNSRMPKKEDDGNETDGGAYWVLKKHDHLTLKSDGVELEEGELFAFNKQGTTVSVCFDLKGAADGGMFISMKDGKTVSQVVFLELSVCDIV